jgi:hypothetical protein
MPDGSDAEKDDEPASASHGIPHDGRAPPATSNKSVRGRREAPVTGGQ